MMGAKVHGLSLSFHAPTEVVSLEVHDLVRIARECFGFLADSAG